MARVSVILSTFDQPRALAFALEGYRRQSFRDFELVVADDGSDGETREVVGDFRRAGDFPLKHVWQENRGFRKAKILNEAVKVSEGGLLVFSDGDCIPHRDFVGIHAGRCPKGGFGTGGCVRLPPEVSAALTREKVRAGEHEAFLTPRDRRRGRWIHWKNLWGLLTGNLRKPKVYGFNLSADRDAFCAVNGYDENFDGFGKEDSDLRNRLRRSGARPVSLWGRAWVFHVDDAADPKIRVRRIPRRKTKEYYSRSDVPVRCENGLVKQGP